MSLDRTEIRELLKLRKFDELSRFGQKKLASVLIGFLSDGDELYRFRAAEALGIVCKNIAESDEEHVRKILRRLFWSLNDESGSYCVGAPLGIGEIGRNAPHPFEGFKNMLVSLVDNWEVELKYVIYAIGRAASSVKDSYPDPIEKLTPLLEHENAEIRGLAAWALGELRAVSAKEALEKLREDNEEITIYDGDFRVVKVGKLVEEVLVKLSQTG
ncbi:DVU0298 family protein [Archaeoglobus veneficus]|uniref:HEAT repeat domain-containing protein n=1 Tax=Archaeoglobus veneficus (strain DSM 11195 / SNP6) TaxID=693661 RepID=F2KR25_ARCVS|nr:DVU0298 family protein [Archaeoglobus veneficus]AEA46662.1 hypothetical protein Arcve_0641 [Archaeoglobus veneficus SNP6]